MYAPDQASIATPIGWVIVEGGADMIHRIAVRDCAAEVAGTSAALREAIGQVAAYFAGRLTRFDLPLAPAVSPRGIALRQAIAAVGYGETAAYGELAERIGSSARALGQACARNPFPLVVPCHRVLPAGGALGPYSAGQGPATKRWLLAHEQRHRAAGDRLL